MHLCPFSLKTCPCAWEGVRRGTNFLALEIDLVAEVATAGGLVKETSPPPLAPSWTRVSERPHALVTPILPSPPKTIWFIKAILSLLGPIHTCLQVSGQGELRRTSEGQGRYLGFSAELVPFGAAVRNPTLYGPPTPAPGSRRSSKQLLDAARVPTWDTMTRQGWVGMRGEGSPSLPGHTWPLLT
jgi:hypothetical protein